jgi:hypothetical protein
MGRRLILVALLLATGVGCATGPFAIPTPVDIAQTAGGAWENSEHSIAQTGLAYTMVPLYTALYVPFLVIHTYIWTAQCVDGCLFGDCSKCKR